MNTLLTFDDFDKTLIVLSATSGGISIVTFSSIIGGPVGIASASFNFGFSLTTGVIKELLIDNNDTLWLNERDIEEKLNRKIYELLQ